MDSLELEIKQMIISSLELEDLTPEDIEDDAPLFNDGLGLDSIDALELGVALRKQFNVKLEANQQDNKKHFHSVKALADFVRSQQAAV
jgi:acyl carrier protein